MSHEATHVRMPTDLVIPWKHKNPDTKKTWICSWCPVSNKCDSTCGKGYIWVDKATAVTIKFWAAEHGAAE